MPRFAANLSFLYTEHDFAERFAAAARDGFQGVEFLFPYAHDTALLARQLADHGLQQVLFNAPPGDWDAGERGTASLPGREAEFKAGLARALDAAAALRCPRVHVMAGLVPSNASAAERAAQRATYLRNLAWAATQAQTSGVTLMIEPINPRDMPGYLLSTQADAHAVLDAVGAPNLQVQMDLYHLQITEGDVSTRLNQYLPTGRVGHIQIAGVPERHEPDSGELNAPYLFELIDRLGYTGWIGCEYRPQAGTSAGLGWLQRWIA